MNFSKVLDGYDYYPKPAVDLAYGTAGFRTKAELLDHVAYRCGILACLRSLATGKVIGMMITASHNPEQDNGVKLIDPMGDMLEISWEKLATNLVNSDKTTVVNIINSIISDQSIEISGKATVLIGWDSRPSSEGLVQIASKGISSIGGEAVKTTLSPTPILHYIVRCRNDPEYGIANIEGYFDKFLTAFRTLWCRKTNEGGNYESCVYFDGANGVGAIAMEKGGACFVDKLKIELFNVEVGVAGKLNYKCGADYVKQLQRIPENVPLCAYKRCVSFDGDADRILYYFVDDEKKFHLIDGDRMAILIAMYLKELLTEANLEATISIVQTAYANGSSTKYITEKLKIDVSCVKTGVKYLHSKATQYDIGVYFEANGHGTVVYSDRLKLNIDEKCKSPSEKELEAIKTLHTFISLTNETVGDAFSDFLIIEMILHAKDWNLQTWEKLYEDLPNRQQKVVVKDRNAIVTEDAERKVKSPKGMQEKIDELVSTYKSARAFVRPSGTEDIVRVYAEAATVDEVEGLVEKVSQLVYDMADGVGVRP